MTPTIGPGTVVKIEGRKFRVLKVGQVVNGLPDHVLLAAVVARGGDDLRALPHAEVEQLVNPAPKPSAPPAPVYPTITVPELLPEPVDPPVIPPADGLRYFAYPALEDAEIFRVIYDYIPSG